MILIDDRSGSKELLPLMPPELCSLTRLEYGDAAFSGNGPAGVIWIGIERKTVPDYADSLSSGRLTGHQLPGLAQSCGAPYIIIEGPIFRTTQSGASDILIQSGLDFGTGSRKARLSGSKGMTAEAFDGSLIMMQEMFGVRVLFTDDIQDTCNRILHLHSWWTKPWESHKSHHKFNPYPSISPSINPPNQFIRTAASISGIGPELARGIAQAVPSLKKLVGMKAASLKNLKGVGRKRAEMMERIFTEENSEFRRNKI
jgi:ERCC4-type nuclease